MFAVFGLGNPGSRYEATRHNVGVWVVERLASGLGLSAVHRDWNAKHECFFSKVTIGEDQCLLAVPDKYMNESGEGVAALSNFFKVDSKQVIIVHDDLDLRPGVIRMRRGGSSAGHRGVEDTASCLGKRDFLRVRVGIGHPRDASGVEEKMYQRLSQDEAVRKWVLERPQADDEAALREAVVDASAAVEVLIKSGLEEAQQQFNRKQ